VAVPIPTLQHGEVRKRRAQATHPLGASGEQNAITALMTIDSKVDGWQVNRSKR
jgi:hypothetical protein